MADGKRKRGRWITIYANGGHAYMEIAGLRFDTSGRGKDGPRWRPSAAARAGSSSGTPSAGTRRSGARTRDHLLRSGGHGR